MSNRRRLLAAGLGAGALLAWGMVACAANDAGHVKGVTAITQVFGDGQKLTAVAIEYDQAIDNAKLVPPCFTVAGRTVDRVYANTTAALAAQGCDGRFVIAELSPDDSGAALYAVRGRSASRLRAKASVTQSGPVVTTAGAAYPPSQQAATVSAVRNLIVDDFRQLEYKDPKTGDTLRYNLFVPRNYDQAKHYPLVLFMHDAGATSTVTDTTLVQGLGAVVWASPADQARHESFVLAPQYAAQIVNDRSEATSALDTTVDLVNQLASQYSIDRKRLYTTGQSGGAMMSIAMDIKYPDLFAASFIVAGQWDAALVKPLAHDKLWIVVSEGDLKAFPGENAITTALEREGARISRATWDGQSTPEQFAAAVAKMNAAGHAIRYTTLAKGTVVPPGQTDDGGSNHVNTWRIAYTIEGIRDWIFEQHR